MTRHNEPSRAIADPQPGWFKIRMVRKGPHVAARLYKHLGFWVAEINGVPCGDSNPDPAIADGVFRIWSTGTPITKAEYDALMHRPPSSPRLPIDIGSEPPAF